MRIETDLRDGILTVVLVGRLDSYAAEACDRLVALGQDGPSPRMVLDLRRLETINSRGLTTILVTAKHLCGRGGKLAIAGAHGIAAQALETAGIDGLVPMRATVAAAIAALAQDPPISA